MDEPAFAGCLVPSRLIGVIEAQQTEDGKIERDECLIAVASNSRTESYVKLLTDLNKAVIEEIEHFFISYNQAKGKQLVPLNSLDARLDEQFVKAGIEKRRAKEQKAVSDKKTI
jgi:inorganic pyrophosphatase